MVVIPELWYDSVMISGCCGADSGSSGAGPVLRLAATCPKCRHSFGVSARAPTVCCATSRALHAMTGGGLVKFQPPPLPPRSPPPLGPPPGWAWLAAAPSSPSPETLSEDDLGKIADAVRMLDLSGWYYRNLSWQESQRILDLERPGTFLLRDSADPKCLFALSMQTERGPTSVRLHRRDGKFRLDSEPHLAPFMPAFECVVALVQHYMRCSNTAETANRRHVWVDSAGDARAAAVLGRPLRRTPPTLAHLSRLAIHGAIGASPAPRLSALPPPHELLPLPPVLVRYLSEYPYSC